MPWPKLGSLHTHGILITSSLCLHIQLSWLASVALSACMKVIPMDWQTAHAAPVDKHLGQQGSMPGADPMRMQ